MRFRKFILFMLMMVLASSFSTMKAYAAEDTIQEQKVVSQGALEVVSQGALEVASQGALEVVSQQALEVTIQKEKEETIQEDKEETDQADKETNQEEKKETNKEDKVEKNKYTDSELRLLSALIYCEAQGESYNGKLAVGIVVMNRVKSNRYPDTLKGVVYQRYQFSPVTNGSLENALEEYDDGHFNSVQEKACIKAARAALSGTTEIIIKDKTVDFSKYLSFSCSLRGATFEIGNHEFK